MKILLGFLLGLVTCLVVSFSTAHAVQEALTGMSCSGGLSEIGSLDFYCKFTHLNF